MADPAPCIACEIVAGRLAPPGGVIHRQGDLHAHPLVGPTAVRGWMVVTTRRHAPTLCDLDDGEIARLYALVARIMRVQRERLGAVLSYALAIGETVRHVHVHVVPRYADTPERLRGPRALLLEAADAVPAAEVERAARTIVAALERGD